MPKARIAAVVALLGMLSLAGSDGAIRVTGQTTVADGVAADATSDNGQRKITRAPDGTLYLIYAAPVPDAEPTSSKYSSPISTATGIFVARSTDGGATWEVEARLSRDGVSSGFGAIAAGPDGRIHASWVDYETVGHVWYAVRGSSGWQPGFKVSPGENYAGLPAIAADTTAVHLLWYAAAPGAPTDHGSLYEIRHTFDDGSGWSEPTLVSTSSEDALNPSLVATSGGLHGAWYQNTGGTYRALTSVWDGTSWMSPNVVSGSGDTTGVSVEASNGSILMVWEQVTGDDRGVAYAEFRSGAWSEPVTLSPPGAADPVVGAGTAGTVVLWSLNEEIQGRFDNADWGDTFTLGSGSHPMLLSGESLRAAWTAPDGDGYAVVFGTLTHRQAASGGFGIKQLLLIGGGVLLIAVASGLLIASRRAG